jgi:hypothetical protein
MGEGRSPLGRARGSVIGLLPWVGLSFPVLTGFAADLAADLAAGLSAGLAAGLSDGLAAGLSAGLAAGLEVAFRPGGADGL